MTHTERVHHLCNYADVIERAAVADEFQLVNTGMGGRLEERLVQLRDQGESMVAIAAKFTSEGYPISRETIRRWLIRVGLPTKSAS
jgi:hypothetical protein